ncbi:MAG: HD-like signal output (HDOD) protein [Phenylobacterium sp.]
MPETETETESNKQIDISSRFHRYMIDMKYALRECDFDDGVNIGEDVAGDKGKEEGGQFERVLLAVEEQRIKKDQLKQQAQSNTINAMAKSLRPHIIKHVQENLKDTSHVIENILRLPANFGDLVDILYSPSMTYSRTAGIVRLNNVHDSNLLHMVNRADFQRQVGKQISNRIRDTQIAISLLGMSGAKALLPVMMLKQTIKLRNEHFPLLGFKLWKLLLSNGLATHHILVQKGYPDPIEGLLGGMLFHIGKITLYHQFVHSFDEVKKKFLIEFRRDNKKPQHDFLLQVEPDASILYQLMEALERSHTLTLVQQLDLQKQRPKGLSMALEQALSICSIQQCSPLARAIRQGNAYAQLEQLRHAKLIGQDNLEPYLEGVGMAKAGMNALLKRNLTRLELKTFVE